MDLFEILVEYLNTRPTKREAFLDHMVKDCGLDPVLLPHIRGIEKRARVVFTGGFEKGPTDVKVFSLFLYTPEAPVEGKSWRSFLKDMNDPKKS